MRWIDGSEWDGERGETLIDVLAEEYLTHQQTVALVRSVTAGLEQQRCLLTMSRS